MRAIFKQVAFQGSRQWFGLAFQGFFFLFFLPWGAASVSAQLIAQEVLSAVVKVQARIPSDARTAPFLGTEREGSGVVIDAQGLVLTIGYLILEAGAVEVVGPDGQAVEAEVVAYDDDTGFGLLRARIPVGVTPMKLGRSAELGERDRVLVAGYGGPEAVRGAMVVSRREFAGYWEYLLEDAIFTMPPYPNFSGAALIGQNGELLGIGHLFVNDALPGRRPMPGNMFVPVDRLKPILADLVTRGRSSTPPRPWLGIFTEEYRGHVFIAGVVPEGPAEKAGLHAGDLVVGVAGRAVKGLSDFYRRVWAQGKAGVEVALNVLRGAKVQELRVRSADRYEYFRFSPAPRPQKAPQDAKPV